MRWGVPRAESFFLKRVQSDQNTVQQVQDKHGDRHPLIRQPVDLPIRIIDIKLKVTKQQTVPDLQTLIQFVCRDKAADEKLLLISWVYCWWRGTLFVIEKYIDWALEQGALSFAVEVGKGFDQDVNIGN